MLLAATEAFVSEQGGAAGREGRPAQARPATPQEEALLRRNSPPTAAGGKLPESPPPGRSCRPRQDPYTPQPRTPAPTPHLLPPRPAQGERRAVTVSTHSNRGLNGIQQPASAQAHTLPVPAPSLPALGTSRAPFAPPAWWCPQCPGGPFWL